MQKSRLGFWKINLPFGFQVRLRFGHIEGVTHRAFLFIAGRGLDKARNEGNRE